MNPFESIQHDLITHLSATYSLTNEQQAAIVTTINDESKKRGFGDLSTNAALVIAKTQGKAPRTIAEEITTQFHHPSVSELTIAGPGFINIALTPAAFTECSHALFTAGASFFSENTNTPRPAYSIEFVSANPTGPLHLGHGRGGIIGDVLGTILKFLGYPTTKEFYINDAGKQIQTLGLSFKARCQQALGITGIEVPEDGYAGTYLVEMAETLITSNKSDIQNALEKGDDNFFALYAKDVLLKQIQTTLKNYHINFDVWFSEKTLHDDGSVEKALTTLIDRGHAFTQDGALWFRSTEFGDDKDRVLKRSNGEVTYVAADVAYMLNKLNRGAEKLIFVLGQDHHSYVSRLKGVMAALGHNPDNLDVILYQLVTLKEDGVALRMSKRAGRIVSLEEIIETVGADVARFFYLNRKADAHLDFDLGLALKKTDENPVFYIQYAYVRTKSIFEKAAEHPELHNITINDLTILDEEERQLLKKIVALKTLLHSITQNYQVHLLSYYAIELANQFHSFYAAHRVIEITNIPQSRKRLALVQILQNTFALSFELLGISCPEKM
ncbi:TPA: arginine--tRNA ligase [Candidatus Dependentiae bacterium]|nr:MAG: Arginine-tRNA ligase [candidate division TM6 bacterium GW2011_GWF2_43_87]HBL98635.1 arginine--tRNA ligase [Candidatus Dependentiae bacterium]